MSGYDFNRPFIPQSALSRHRSRDPEVTARYGLEVLASSMSNSEYAQRFNRMARENQMKPPPSHGRTFAGYLVVRRPNTSAQYETWMPDHVFDEIYEPVQKPNPEMPQGSPRESEA